MPKTVVSEYQVAIFPKDFVIDKVGEVAAKLMKMSEDFDPDTVSMNPFNMTFPPDIERVSITSSNKKMKLSISPKKIAFYWSNTDLEEDYQFNEKENINLIKRVINVLDIKSLTIQRVGFITNLIRRDADPNKLIKENLLKTPIENQLTSAQLKLTYKTSLEINSNCNLHIAIASGYLNDNKEEKVASIQFDLNTHQDEILTWGVTEVSQFISQAKKKSEPGEIYSVFFSDKHHGTTI